MADSALKSGKVRKKVFLIILQANLPLPLSRDNLFDFAVNLFLDVKGDILPKQLSKLHYVSLTDCSQVLQSVGIQFPRPYAPDVLKTDKRQQFFLHPIPQAEAKL